MDTAGVVLIVAIALFFDFTNGFHDAANAIATSISTRALTPRAALALAAVMNLVGSLVSVKVANTVRDIVDAGAGTHGLVLVFAALVGAVAWNLTTWYFGLPSSSSHALIGALVGAGLASDSHVHWGAVVDKVVIPMVLSPLVGFALGMLLMLVLLWVFRRGRPHRLNRGFRVAQVFSSAALAYGHGLQDAQKTMGIITLALITTDHLPADAGVPLWVKFAAAAAIALGTYSGGWRIMRTLGRRVIHMTPSAGFAAQAASAGVLLGTAQFGWPVSTTHILTSSIMGAGATQRLSAVRWGIAGNIVTAWVLTIPAAAVVAYLVYDLAHLFVA